VKHEENLWKYLYNDFTRNELLSKPFRYMFIPAIYEKNCQGGQKSPLGGTVDQTASQSEIVFLGI